MQRFQRQDLQQLVERQAAAGGPCVSVYLPLEPRAPAAPLRLLTQRARDLLARHYPETGDRFVAPLADFASGREGQDVGAKGVALFTSSHVEGYVPLAETPAPLAVVAESFHVRPLLGLLQGQQTFLILKLDRREVSILEGSPRSLTELATYRVLGDPESPSVEATLELFVRVDGGLRTALAPQDTPLILSGPPSLQGLYRELAAYRAPFLAGLAGGTAPSRLELHSRAWGLARTMLVRRKEDALGAYEEARPKGLATDSLSEIARAAATGRVETLFLEAGMHLWGSLCRNSGALRLEQEPHKAAVDDILDDLAELTLVKGGRVYALSDREMPTPGGIAAILRPSTAAPAGRIRIVEVQARR